MKTELDEDACDFSVAPLEEEDEEEDKDESGAKMIKSNLSKRIQLDTLLEERRLQRELREIDGFLSGD